MKKNTVSNDLEILQKERNDICVSIIMPTHRLSPDRRTDTVQLEKTIQEAKSQLQSQYFHAAVTPLVHAIDELYDQIDFVHNSAGIGLFVSHNLKMLIHFSFPVRERITIDRSFDIRDVIYESYFNIPYLALLLSQKEARLFKGSLNSLSEITDSNFPQRNGSEYEYSRPTRGSSYLGHTFIKDIERDKSVVEEIRLKSFFRETDELLNSYLNNGAPLIMGGENKDLSYFRQITTHQKNIACNIPGNYMAYNEHELGALTWKAIKLFRENSKDKLISDFNEKVGEGRGIKGIENIWKAVQEGRGYKLLVEKDYVVPGYLSNNDDYELFLHEPQEPHRTLPDVVNTLIDRMLEKNGEVIIVENDALRYCNRLALITRY